MTASPLRIATWNICGRRVNNSPEVAPAGAVEEVIHRERPDILCLQEVHFYEGEPEVQLLKELSSAGLDNFIGLPLSRSHLDESARLGVGIASAWPLSGKYAFWLSNPGLQASVDGEWWDMHDKGMIGCRVKTSQIPSIQVFSLHLFPFHAFRIEGEEEYVAEMWSEFWKYADSLIGEDPVILAGDFNQEKRELSAERWSMKKWYFSAEGCVTTTWGLPADDVVVSFQPRQVAVRLVPTFSDHYFVTTVISP
jgi:exonuclease III